MQRLPVRQPFLLVRCDAAKLFTFSDLCSYLRVLLQCLKQRIRQDLFEPKTPYIVFTALPPVIHSLSSVRRSAPTSAAGLPAITREDLFDPNTNIAVGAAEYSQKLAFWNGNHVLAIASYNAGEKAVGTWIEKTPVDDLDLFIESIPYAETRLYVKTVTRNRFEYRRIYESQSAAANRTATP